MMQFIKHSQVDSVRSDDREGKPMSVRALLHSCLFMILLSVWLVTGCAKRSSLPPDATDSQATEETADSATTVQNETEALTAQRERERQAGIEERERQVIEESMRRRLAETPPTTPQAAMTLEDFVNQDVHFSYDSHTLSEDAKALLERKAAWLAEHPQIEFKIEGHCDERGTTIYNLVLGERRAHAVKQYLTALGISASRLSIISYGEEFPLDPGHTEEAWFRNRRAHFAITRQ
jgi:peptidoglycan-associated lipoprotein